MAVTANPGLGVHLTGALFKAADQQHLGVVTSKLVGILAGQVGTFICNRVCRFGLGWLYASDLSPFPLREPVHRLSLTCRVYTRAAALVKPLLGGITKSASGRGRFPHTLSRSSACSSAGSGWLYQARLEAHHLPTSLTAGGETSVAG